MRAVEFVRCRHHPFAIRAELRAPRRAGMKENRDLVAVVRPPDAGRRIARRRHNPIAVRTEGCTHQDASVAFENRDLLATLCFPEAGRLVDRRRHYPRAVRAERRAPHRAIMAFQDADRLTALRIPESGRFVARRRHHPLAVAAECHVRQRASMASQDGDLLAALHVPDARRAVDRRRHHPLAVAAERRVPEGLVWPFRTAISLPLSVSQIRAVLSSDAVTTREPPLPKAALSTGPVVAFQDGDLLAALHIPDTRGAIAGRRHHPLAIAAERGAPHGSYGLSGRRSPCRSPHPRCARCCRQTPSPPASPSPLNAALFTGASWPFRTAISLPLSASQRRAVCPQTPSPPACRRG